MSSYLEFDAKTIKLAIQKASEELNIPITKLKHDVLSYGSTGIFGLVGAKKARIRVRLPEIAKNGSEAEEQTSQKNVPDESPILSDTQPEEDPDLSADLLQKNNTDSPPGKLVDVGRDALEQILNLISSDVNITVEEDIGIITFSIHSENPSIIIGKRGQTIEAIQYIVEKIINKHSDKKSRVEIDIGDYLKNKQTKLQTLAEKMAKKAKRTGKPATISKMNAYNRRIIHLALKDDNEIKTVSIGKNFLRKLVIFPIKKKSSQKESG